MSVKDLIPTLAAVTCWELSLIFLVVYLRVNRRAQNRVYAALAFFLGAMIWCAMMLQDARERHADLFWYRLHFFCVYITIAALIHFLALVTRRPLPRPLTPRRVYVLMGLLSLFGFCPAVLHLVPPGTAPLDFDSDTWGPLYPLYCIAPVAAAVAACAATLRGLARRTIRLPPPDDASGALLHLRERDLLWIAGSAAGVLFASILEITQQILLPRLNVALNPRALATVVFCATSGWALAQAILRNEEWRRRLHRESASSDALARARLQATHDMQHQIKNRLAAVALPLRNALRGAREGGASPERQNARLAAALGETQELFLALDTMLNVARLAAGEPVHLGPKRAVDAIAVVEAACRRRSEWEQERREGSGGRGARWEFGCETLLERPWVFLHTDDLDHVLAVLLDNAVKYSPGGGPVCVRLWEEAGRLRLSVSDRGIGIPASELDRIGTRAFYQGDGAGQPFGGTGLGLYLSRRLVEAQGGRLWAESVLGAGATIHLSLPLESAEMTKNL